MSGRAKASDKSKLGSTTCATCAPSRGCQTQSARRPAKARSTPMYLTQGTEALVPERTVGRTRLNVLGWVVALALQVNLHGSRGYPRRGTGAPAIQVFRIHAHGETSCLCSHILFILKVAEDSPGASTPAAVCTSVIFPHRRGDTYDCVRAVRTRRISSWFENKPGCFAYL